MRSRSRRGAPAPKPQKPRTPAWKVLLTVIIILLSMTILVACTAGMFKEHLGSIVDKFFSPEPDAGSSWSDETDPVADGGRPKGVYNFLVAGVNADLGNNTDTLMLVQYKVDDGQINVVQIPRDTFINDKYNFHKINSVFSAAYNAGSGKVAERRVTGMAGDKDKGIVGLCEFVEKAYTVKIDYYMLIDLDAFQGLIDKLGGLTVDVPCRMQYSDPEQNLYIDLQPGVQTLSGYDAMCLVRNRKTYADADYGRMNAQKIVLAALLKQIKSDFSPTTLKTLIEFTFDNVTTNLSLSDCIYFGTNALNVNMEDMKMVTMPSKSTYINGSSYALTSEPSSLEVINKYLNVYDKDITAEEFDRGYRLTMASDEEIHKQYLYEAVKYEVYDAQRVDEDSIHMYPAK